MIRHPDGSVTVTYKFEVTRGRKGRKQLAPPAAPIEQDTPPASLRPVIDPSSIPKLTRLLVLGHHFERLVRDGVVVDYTQLARLTGLSKARVTQILNLTMLPPDVQLEVLLLDGADVRRHRLFEKTAARLAAAHSDWNEQRAAWNSARKQ